MTEHAVVIVGSVVRIMVPLLRAADRQTSSRPGHWAGVLNAYYIRSTVADDASHTSTATPSTPGRTS